MVQSLDEPPLFFGGFGSSRNRFLDLIWARRRHLNFFIFRKIFIFRSDLRIDLRVDKLRLLIIFSIWVIYDSVLPHRVVLIRLLNYHFLVSFLNYRLLLNFRMDNNFVFNFKIILRGFVDQRSILSLNPIKIFVRNFVLIFIKIFIILLGGRMQFFALKSTFFDKFRWIFAHFRSKTHLISRFKTAKLQFSFGNLLAPGPEMKWFSFQLLIFKFFFSIFVKLVKFYDAINMLLFVFYGLSNII